MIIVVNGLAIACAKSFELLVSDSLACTLTVVPMPRTNLAHGHHPNEWGLYFVKGLVLAGSVIHITEIWALLIAGLWREVVIGKVQVSAILIAAVDQPSSFCQF